MADGAENDESAQNLPEGVWAGNTFKSRHHEVLAHSFGGKKSFFALTAIKPDVFEEYIGVVFCPDKESLENDEFFDGSHMLPYSKNDCEFVKSLVADTIKRFDQKNDVNMKEINNHLASRITEYKLAELKTQISLRRRLQLMSTPGA